MSTVYYTPSVLVELGMLQEANIVHDWINEGIEKGEVKATRNDILDVLDERFGVVKKGIGIRLAAIDDPAAKTIQTILPSPYTVSDEPPKRGKDVNDYLKMITTKNPVHER